jgi:D-alanyl-lipoteichoic acid acyltransferase DltB (MBOAT superfamily)
LLAKRIEAASEKRKRPILIVAFIICFGILILLKYISALPVFEIPVMIFGNQTTVHTFVRTYLLPIGLSYYTLQVLSFGCVLGEITSRTELFEDSVVYLLFSANGTGTD